MALNHCFEKFTSVLAVNIKTRMEPLRDSQVTPTTEHLIISRNVQYCPKLLVSYENTFVQVWSSFCVS